MCIRDRIESEKDLVETFGEPQETSSQYEYWLSASSYLSYGGVLRVVRTDGGTLNNANAAVASGAGSSLSSLKIKSTDDYFNSYESATTWYYAAKNPGTWGNGLKVCTIDSIADQTLSGVSTAGVVVGAGITQAFGGVTIGGIGTSLVLNGHLTGTVTGVGASSIDVKVVSEVAVGGSITANELLKNNKDVLIIEKGSWVNHFKLKHPGSELFYKWRYGGLSGALGNIKIQYHRCKDNTKPKNKG